MKTYPAIRLTLTDWKPRQEKAFKRYKANLLREREAKQEILAWRGRHVTLTYND